jgi:hypothetical protein
MFQQLHELRRVSMGIHHPRSGSYRTQCGQKCMLSVGKALEAQGFHDFARHWGRRDAQKGNVSLA